jgi:hypothetical protein
MPCRKLVWPAALVAGLLLAAGRGRAQEAPAASPPDDGETIELLAPKAPEPQPALKYRLAITLGERKPGNAATHYYRALLLARQLPKEHLQEHQERYDAWHKGPRDQFPRAEVAKWLAAHRRVFDELQLAAYREHCEWDLRIQDLRGPEVYSIVLPEIQECRELARSLSLKARSEMVEGRLDDAFETLRQGYQLARDVAQQPFIVCGLVGVAIASVMHEELRQLIEESDSNYYWAIASLPQPAVDLRPALQFEVLHTPLQIFPFLKDAETAQRSPDQWRQVIVECLRDLGSLGAGQQFDGWQGELAAAAYVTKLYPVAKQAMIESGLDRDRVEGMPVGQVVAIHTARATQRLGHEMIKNALLPYDEALPRMAAVNYQTLLGDPLSGSVGLPIAPLLMPAVQSAYAAQTRLARTTAALQAIEALRMHAAASGKLPAALADVTIVPVPNNPATGQPFPYRLDAATGAATLEAPAVAGIARDGKRYVIRLR